MTVMHGAGLADPVQIAYLAAAVALTGRRAHAYVSGGVMVLPATTPLLTGR